MDFAKARELFGFGKWILGSVILIFLVTQVDSIVVGALVGVAALGFYQMAYTLASTPTTEIAHVISQVTFPAYVKLQEDAKALRAGYLKVLKLTSFFSFGLACIFLVLADDFVVLFLGEKWSSIIPVMQILVIAGAVRSIAATTGPVFTAIGKPRIDTAWQLLRFTVLFGLVFPLSLMWGIEGAAVAVLASICISTIGFTNSAVKVTGCGYVPFLKTLTIPIILTISTISVMSLARVIMQLDGLAEFAVLLVFGLLMWSAMTLAFDRYTGYGMKPLLQSIIGSLRKRR